MKKLLAVMMVFALLLALNACGKKNTEQTETNAPETEAPAILVPEENAGVDATEKNEETEAATEATEADTPVVDNPFGEVEGEDTPTQPAATEPKPTEKHDNDKKPQETKPAGDKNPTDSTKPTEKPGSGDSDAVTYEEYMQMTATEQRDYMESFESVDAFFAWYNAAKAEYDAQNPDIEVGNGSIDMGDIIGGNG